MNIPQPVAPEAFPGGQVSGRGCDSRSESMGELIRRDQKRLQLRGLLLAGASAPAAAEADGAYFATLRQRVSRRSRW